MLFNQRQHRSVRFLGVSIDEPEHPDAAYALARQRYADLGVDTDAALRRWPRSRSRSTAGRETTSAASRIRTASSGGGLAATGNYPGQGADGRRAAPRRGQGAVADPGHAIASTCTPSTASSAPGASTATRSVPSTSPAGSTGRNRWASGSTSTRPASRIRRRPTTSRSRIPTQRSARSGSGTRRPAAASAPPWARRSARRASPTCGSPTA